MQEEQAEAFGQQLRLIGDEYNRLLMQRVSIYSYPVLVYVGLNNVIETAKKVIYNGVLWKAMTAKH